MESLKPEENIPETPQKWTAEEEQDIKKIAYTDFFEKRMKGEIPAEQLDKMLKDHGIQPWTPEAEKFMREWDWGQAEKEYLKRKQEKESPKDEAYKELTGAHEEVEAVKSAEIPPEVANLPERVADDPKAIEAELAKLPEEVRQRIGFSLSNIGYWIERSKGESMAKAVEKALGKVDPKDRGLVDRFLSSVKEKLARHAEVPDRKMEDIEKGKSRTLGNIGYVAKNAYYVGRPIADFVGWTATLPLRYVSLIAASGAATADVLKETRLKNEKAIEKTRINDIEEAQKEAIRVYEKAGGTYNPEKGGNGVGAEALKKAYLEDIPASLKDRLRNNPEAGIISKVSNGFFTWHIEKSVNNLNKKVAKIESRTDWNRPKKDYEKEILISL